MRRRWLGRPLPDLRRRFKTNREEVVEGVEGLPLGSIDVVDSPAALITAIVVIALLVLVVLPLLGVALELIGVLVVLGSGLLGRVLLGRPWIVEAVNLGDPKQRAAFEVKGWRKSGEALKELRDEVAAGISPARRRGASP